MMPATNSTPNYELPIYLPNDHFSVLGDLNGAMETIDGTLATVASSVGGAAANAAAALTAATEATTIAGEARTSAAAASVSANAAAEAATTARTVADDAASQAGEAVTMAQTARSSAQAASSAAAQASQDATNAVSTASSAHQIATQAVEEQAFLRSASLQNDMRIESGDRVTDIVALTLTGLIPGRVYSISGLMELHVPTGTGNDKNMVLLVDTNEIYKEYYNSDEFRATLEACVPFKATSTTHVVTMKCDSAATGYFDVLAAGTRLYVW